jgi:hypothetical protein
MGPCIVSIFQYKCISNKMQRYTVYLYLETALHISGGTSTHNQERIQLYLQHLLFVTTLLLSAAIVEELESVWVCCGWRTPSGKKLYIPLGQNCGRRFCVCPWVRTREGYIVCVLVQELGQHILCMSRVRTRDWYFIYVLGPEVKKDILCIT